MAAHTTTHVRPPRRRLAVAGILAALAGLAGCYGGDSSPEEPAGGGVPPQDANPAPNIGQSEGYPDPVDGPEEAQQ